MQRRMRVAHQLHAVGGVVRVQADAQAGAHVLRAHLRQLPRLRQAFHRGGRQLRQLGARRGAQQHHRELVIGQPRHQALPRQQLGDALGHLAEQRIAHAVAVGFVHALEVVQVDQQQRHAAVGAVRVARGLGHGALQRVFKVAAVGQASERIKVRHAVQLLFVAQHCGLGRAQAVEQAHHNGLPQRGQQQHQQAAHQDQCLHARPPIGRHKKQHQRDGRQRHGQQRHVVHGLIAQAAIGRICRHGKPQRARTPAEYQRRHREAGVEPDARLHRAADDHEVPLHPAQAIAQQAQQHQHVRTLDAHPHRRNGQRRDARRSQKPRRVQHQHRAHGQRTHPARRQIEHQRERQQRQHRTAKVQRRRVSPVARQARKRGTDDGGRPQRPTRQKQQVGGRRERVPVQRHLHVPHHLPQGHQHGKDQQAGVQSAVGGRRLPPAAPGPEGRQPESQRPGGVVQKQPRARRRHPQRRQERQRGCTQPDRCEDSFREGHGSVLGWRGRAGRSCYRTLTLPLWLQVRPTFSPCGVPGH